MKNTIAVTGANGHLGNVVCRVLCEKGYHVKAFYHNSYDSLLNLPVEEIKGSVLDKNDLNRLIDGCEIVINCAAIISIDGDPSGIVFKTNTIGPANVLEVSIEKGVQRIIHISSVHAVIEAPYTEYFDEKRPYKSKLAPVYDFSKALGEQILLEKSQGSQTEIVILRPSCIVGPFDFKPSEIGNALINFYHNKYPVLPEGGYDFVDVRDVANSIVQAMNDGKNGEIYLVSGKYKKLTDLSKIIHQVTGRKTPKTVLSYQILRMLIPVLKLFAFITCSKPLLTLESIKALRFGHSRMDNSKAVQQIGHHCRPVEESIRDFYEWQISNKRI